MEVGPRNSQYEKGSKFPGPFNEMGSRGQYNTAPYDMASKQSHRTDEMEIREEDPSDDTTPYIPDLD